MHIWSNSERMVWFFFPSINFVLMFMSHWVYWNFIPHVRNILAQYIYNNLALFSSCFKALLLSVSFEEIWDNYSDNRESLDFQNT